MAGDTFSRQTLVFVLFFLLAAWFECFKHRSVFLNNARMHLWMKLRCRCQVGVPTCSTHHRSSSHLFSHPSSVRLTPPFIPSFSFLVRDRRLLVFFFFFCLSMALFLFFFPPSDWFLTSSLIPPLFFFLLRLSSALLFPFNPSVVLSKLIRL